MRDQDDRLDITVPSPCPHIGPEKVLVMDDDPVMRTLFDEMLKLLGYDAVCVCEGAEAITAYEHTCMTIDAFVVVILDLHNQVGMGGEATLVKLREIDPQIKAIVCSGDRRHPVMHHFQAKGFVRALVKPFSIEELHDVLVS